MAGKKSVDPTRMMLKVIGDVMERASFPYYFYSNRYILTKTDFVCIMTMDDILWESFQKDHPEMKEIDPTIKDQRSLIRYNHLCDKNWVEMDSPEELYQGKLYHITIPEFDYDISITKEMLPIKLLKKEFNHIYTSLNKEKESYLFGIKKSFVEGDHYFDIMRFFQIV